MLFTIAINTNYFHNVCSINKLIKLDDFIKLCKNLFTFLRTSKTSKSKFFAASQNQHDLTKSSKMNKKHKMSSKTDITCMNMSCPSCTSSSRRSSNLEDS